MLKSKRKLMRRRYGKEKVPDVLSGTFFDLYFSVLSVFLFVPSFFCRKHRQALYILFFVFLFTVNAPVNHFVFIRKTENMGQFLLDRGDAARIHAL